VTDSMSASRVDGSAMARTQRIQWLLIAFALDAEDAALPPIVGIAIPTGGDRTHVYVSSAGGASPAIAGVAAAFILS
jgi:hypothetical protein